MKRIDDAMITRYLRLAVQDHPLRAKEYIDALLDSGCTAPDVARNLLLRARDRALSLRAAQMLNAPDTSAVLGIIRSALASLRFSESEAEAPKVERLPVGTHLLV